MSPCRYRVGRHRRGLTLIRQPGFEIGWRKGDDSELHAGVLKTAVLRALASIDTGCIRLKPGGIHLSRHQVQLPLERRHPEAVDHVFWAELAPTRAAGGYVYLVRRSHGARLGRGGV